MTDAANVRIGFLGAGKMATALARGWLAAGLADTDARPGQRPRARGPRGLSARPRDCASRPTTARWSTASDVLVLAVKPQSMAALLAEIRPAVASRHLVVSIAAGITLRQLADGLGAEPPAGPRHAEHAVPGRRQRGRLLARPRRPRAEDVALVDRLLNAVGRAFRLPENLLDAVTGLSGSGPAFVYVMIEALSDGGVRMGLPRDVATALAAQTVFGAAKMVLETGTHPGVLKDMVASPGGTTIAGLHALERGGLRAALMDAVEAATRRSTELAKG